MRQILFTAALLLLTPGPAMSDIWTETFDTGVGRFDETLVDGDSLFVWDGSHQRIHGDFRRDGQAHRRYADIGRMYNANDTIGFSVVVTPGARNSDNTLTVAADLGFYNSILPPESRNNRVGISLHADRDNYGWFSFFGLGSPPQSGSDIQWYAHHTYFVEFLYEGNLDLVTWSVYEGVDSSGVFLGTRQNDLTGDPFTVDVDRLGMGGDGNGMLPGQNYDAWVLADVDNFSFTVPEPSTALLFGAASFFALCRRRK